MGMIVLKKALWKNSEDQILKAAVMKYGLNQWDRISSLLLSRSSKECKNRWYSWLNPRIKKTEWTFEEDERLIYLYYIFPAQWSTISSLIGRTVDSCVMRFEKLINTKVFIEKDARAGNNIELLNKDKLYNKESLPPKYDNIENDI